LQPRQVEVLVGLHRRRHGWDDSCDVHVRPRCTAFGGMMGKYTDRAAAQPAFPLPPAFPALPPGAVFTSVASRQSGQTGKTGEARLIQTPRSGYMSGGNSNLEAGSGDPIRRAS